MNFMCLVLVVFISDIVICSCLSVLWCKECKEMAFPEYQGRKCYIKGEKTPQCYMTNKDKMLNHVNNINYLEAVVISDGRDVIEIKSRKTLIMTEGCPI